jgi:branched-chain amino acid transport system substrate-binding protein
LKLRNILWAATASASMLASVHAQDVWKIGALYPMTGSLALLGTENLNGARVAVDMINE